MIQAKSTTFVCCVIFCILFSLLMVFLGSFLHARVPTSVSPSPDSQELTVVLDAGHGGEDGGAIGVDGSNEKEVNLSIALKIEQILRICGRNVVMTRREDVLLYDKGSDYHGKKKVQDLKTRRQIAEQTENAVFVSIHMNAFPQEQYCGLQVWYSQNHKDSQVLANLIQEESRERLLPDNHRKIKASGDDLYLLHHLTCPAVLVECGFLSNREECASLATEEYRQKLSLSIALSLLRYCEETEKSSQNQLDFSSDLLYNEGVRSVESVLLGGDHERRKNSLYLFFL